MEKKINEKKALRASNMKKGEAFQPRDGKLSYEQLEQVANQQQQVIRGQAARLEQLDEFNFKVGLTLEILKLTKEWEGLFHKDFIRKTADTLENLYAQAVWGEDPVDGEPE